MFFVVAILQLHFSDYYNGEYVSLRDKHERIIITTNNFWIQFCSFFGLYCSGSGGAIFSSISRSDFLIDHTVFAECHSSENAGAILKSDTTYGSFVLSNSCGFSCCCGNDVYKCAPFCYVLSPESGFINFEMSSISRSSPFISLSQQATSINKGTQLINQCNYSHNYMNYHSAIHFGLSSSTTISLSTFDSMISSSNGMIWTNNCSNTTIRQVNFVSNNMQNNGGMIVAYMKSKIRITGSIFFNNTKKAFTNYETSIDVENCILQTGYTTEGSINQKSNSVGVTQTILLERIYLHNCMVSIFDKCYAPTRQIISTQLFSSIFILSSILS